MKPCPDCNATGLGACKACNLGGSVGTCVNHGAGTDPETACGACRICDGNGSCTTASAGDDPKFDCSAQNVSTCGRTGANAS